MCPHGFRRACGALLTRMVAVAKGVGPGASATNVAQENAFADALMLQHGVPSAAIESLRRRERTRDGWDASVAVTRTLEHGETLRFAHRSWRIWHRPGHSPFDTVFHDERRGQILLGDHLIANVSSNPVIARPSIGSPDSRSHALLLYRESLRRTRRMDARVGYPGHGPPIDDHRGLIDRRLAGMDRRKEEIAAVIGERAPTAHEVARRIWRDRAVAEPHLTLFEVLGCVDRLHGEGRVVEAHDGRVVRLIAT